MVASEASASGFSVSPSSTSPTARGTQVPLPSGIARTRGNPKRPFAPGLKRMGEGGMPQSSCISPRPSLWPSVTHNMASSSNFSGPGTPRASDLSSATGVNQQHGVSSYGSSVFSAPFFGMQATDSPDSQDSPVEQGKVLDDQKKCTRCRKQKFYKYCAYRHCRSCCFSRRDTCPAHLKVLGYSSGNFGPQRNTNPGCADCTHYLADQRCSFQRCRECCLRRHLPCPSHNQYCVSVSEPFWPSRTPVPQPSAQDVDAAAAAAAAATFAYDFHSSSIASMLNSYPQNTQPALPLPSPAWPSTPPSAAPATAPPIMPPPLPTHSNASLWPSPTYLHQQAHTDPFSLYIPTQPCPSPSPSTPSPSSSNSSPSICSSITSSTPDSPGFSIPFFGPNGFPSTVTGPTTWGSAAAHFRPSPNTSPHPSSLAAAAAPVNAFTNPKPLNITSSSLPLYGYDDPFSFLHILGDDQRSSPSTPADLENYDFFRRTSST